MVYVYLGSLGLGMALIAVYPLKYLVMHYLIFGYPVFSPPDSATHQI